MPTREDEEADVFAAWQERYDRGERVDPEDVIRAHPHLAEGLRRRFAALDLVDLALGAAVPAARGEPFSPGTALGPYRIVSELGAGGMGRVYLSRLEGRVPGVEAQTQVAVKVVHPHLLHRRGFLERFLREAAVGKQVTHPNVVRTFHADALSIAGSPIHLLVMEFVEGQTLRALLNELERVPEELCRHIGREVAKGLGAIHATGAVHRDLKPENVLITKEHTVKVMDLGTARLTNEEARLSQTGVFVGSFEYAAPEQFEQSGADVDARADLHALGVVLYELSTGAPLYRADDFRAAVRKVLHETPRRLGEVNPQVSPFFEELVHTLLEKDRANRFQTAADVERALEEGEKGAWWRERASALRAKTKRPLRRIRIPRETALVGRDPELSTLKALYERAKLGDGNVVLVEGEAGIGKSRLVDEFVGKLQAAGEDVNFLYGSYPPAGAATTSGAFASAYREHFGTEGLEGALRAYLPITPLLVPAFAALLRGDAPPLGSEPLTKDSLQTVFVHATRALAAERTTIVLIDDLHFAPHEGRALFASLALAVPEHRILLIGTSRPGIDDTWVAGLARPGNVTRLPLPRLGAKDLVQLLTDALHSERLAAELSGQIALKSDGNPFFVFEILQGLKEGQFLTQQPDGTWVTTEILRDIRVPSSIRDLVQGRVSGLGTQERDLLDVASCLGFEFDPALVAQAAGLALIPVLKGLAQVERAHRLVRAAGERFVFDHHQVQEALYESLPDPLRRAYHTAIADALETREGATEKDPTALDGALWVEICEHNFKGGRGEHALRFLDGALTHLDKAYLNDHAVALADRALATPGLVAGPMRCELLLAQSTRLNLLGRVEQQRACAAQAVAFADTDGSASLRSRAHQSLGTALRRGSQNIQAVSCFLLAQEISRAHGDLTHEASAETGLGIVLSSEGRFAEARDRFERALLITREMGNRDCEARARSGLGKVSLINGRLPEAREHFERALELFREGGNRKEEAGSTSNLGSVAFREGHNAKARGHFQTALAISRRIGDRIYEATINLNLGSLFLLEGRLSEARGHLDQALAISRENGDRTVEGFAIQCLGTLADGEGDTSTALRFADEALALRRTIRHRDGVVESLLQLGDLRRRSGDPDGARTALAEGLSLARELHLAAQVALLLAVLECLPGGNAGVRAAAVAAATDNQRSLHNQWLLWEATHDLVHLAEAKRLLDEYLSKNSGAASLLIHNRLNRQIAEAAAAFGVA